MTIISAKVIADSISAITGARLTSLQLCYPRFIHSEFMTHRVFSRNASSSRAIPVKKMLEMIRNEPAMPVHWGKNQPGMQAKAELDYPNRQVVQLLWMEAAKAAAGFAERMEAEGAHKQVVNRILEPFQHIHVVVTATEWDNFYALRAHPDADPTIQALALEMRAVMDASTPIERGLGSGVDSWHLPYITDDERNDSALLRDPLTLVKMSAARCARVSYLRHDGLAPSVEDDLELFNQLVTRPFTDKRGHTLELNDPIHASPVEHQARVMAGCHWSGNFRGWTQYRKLVETGVAPAFAPQAVPALAV